MKKYILSSLVLLLFSFNASAETIKINLQDIPKQVVEKAKPMPKGMVVKAELDLTNVVAFVHEWQSLESRKEKLMDLYSNVIPKVFKKYPKSREFHFSTYINFKNKHTNKIDSKYISKIVITRDDCLKMDWDSFKANREDSLKMFKTLDFSKI